MLIEDKLRLSDQPYAICFFNEGIFVRLYDKSIFLAVEHLKLNLSVNLINYKKLNHRLVLKAGLSKTVLLKKYPNAIKYNWGYKLKGDWNFKQHDYQTWRNGILNHQLTESTAASEPIRIF